LTTSAQAASAISQKLTQVYGAAWTSHSPSWSEPQCEPPVDANPPGDIGCQVEFEHAGTWHLVSANVTAGKVTFDFTRTWTRDWGPNSAGCQHNITIVGELSANDGACFALILEQNFAGRGSTHRTVSYTGFKRTILVYATDSLVWPDFNLFHCTQADGVYQCLNRFGDGFRWTPHPVHRTSRPTRPAPWCSTGDLRITETGAQAALGTLLVQLGYRNRTSHTCLTGGFPGVTVLGAGGRRLSVARREAAPGLSRYPLRPGQQVYGTVGYHHFGVQGQTCPAVKALRIHAPNSTESTVVSLRTSSVQCGSFSEVYRLRRSDHGV
jgi:hypothetical protein